MPLTALALVLSLSGVTAQARASRPASVVRVDQAGYLSGARKVAYVMGRPRALAHARYVVVNARGRRVMSGRVGRGTGRWNRRYPRVRRIDLTRLRRTGTYRIRLRGSTRGTSPRFRVSPNDAVRRSLLTKNVRFFQAQRDGADVLPRVLGRRPSHLLDREATVYAVPSFSGERLRGKRLTRLGGPVDVEGGWFDAGDFLKFTGTTAFAVTALLIAARDGSVPGLRAEAGHGLAWLDKMWDGDSGTLYAQVGLGIGNQHVLSDHDVWRLPEKDDRLRVRPGDPGYTISHRPVFRANDPGRPIPPSLAGRVAAAFALASQAATGPEQAKRWLSKAAAVYAQADVHPSGPRDNATAIPAAFYPEDSWQDDLELAAAELAVAGRRLGDHRADQWQRQARAWMRGYVASDARGTLEVADVSALAHAELIDLGDSATLLAERDLRRQLDSGVRRSRSDPFGSGVSSREFDSVPHTLGLIATASLYERSAGDDRYRAFAARQRGWVLGANPWGTSFIVGVGRRSPRCLAHQVANLAGRGRVVGAVVNGPNRARLLRELNTFPTMKPCSSRRRANRRFDGRGARFVEHVGAWQTNEPAIDFVANSVLAFGVRRS